MGPLDAWVVAGEAGPVIMLAGESDLTGAGQLDALITGQLAAATWQLTIDASGLRFADAATIRALARAARTLTERGGSLVLLDPQPSVGKVLHVLGADQWVTVRGKAEPGPGRIRKARDEHGTG